MSTQLAPQAVVTEEEIQRVVGLKPQLPHPFKLGVYLMKPVESRWLSGWKWLPEDKDRFMKLGADLQQQGVISEVVYVSPAITSSEELKAVRLAAARTGVDAVLVVSAVSDIDRYNNALGPTYIALVTPFFVPGTVADALFVSHAGLWDVRNGFLYASIEADGTAKQMRPAVWIDEEELVNVAKQDSLRELAEVTGQHIRAIAK